MSARKAPRKSARSLVGAWEAPARPTQEPLLKWSPGRRGHTGRAGEQDVAEAWMRKPQMDWRLRIGQETWAAPTYRACQVLAEALWRSISRQVAVQTTTGWRGWLHRLLR